MTQKLLLGCEYVSSPKYTAETCSDVFYSHEELWCSGDQGPDTPGEIVSVERRIAREVCVLPMCSYIGPLKLRLEAGGRQQILMDFLIGDGKNISPKILLGQGWRPSKN